MSTAHPDPGSQATPRYYSVTGSVFSWLMKPDST
jgi:hypothetical protein